LRLSATIGFVGQRLRVFVQRFVQPSLPRSARAAYRAPFHATKPSRHHETNDHGVDGGDTELP
jgi:hypothetical protein